MESNIDTLLLRNAVPIIDLGNSIENVAKYLKEALSEKGYALLINHGISNKKVHIITKSMRPIT